MTASDPQFPSFCASAGRIAVAAGAATALVTGGMAVSTAAFAASPAILALCAAPSGVAVGWVTYWLSNRALVRSRAQAIASLRPPADPSRTAFPVPEGGLEPMIDSALAEAHTSGLSVSVLAIAIDQLDDIGLGLGLHIVQAVRSEILARLRLITRANEPLVERSGGTMILALRSRPGDNDDARLAQRLLDQFDPLLDIGPERIKVSLSIGIARQSASLSGSGGLVRQAEIALYEAQRLGGSRSLLYTPEIDDIFDTHFRIAHELTEAVERRMGLGMVYQPIFATNRSAMAGAEALLRWNHPVYGRLDRRLLIEIAQAEDLIVPLGDWIFDMALGRLVRSGLPWIAVNIAGGQLRAPQFADRLKTRLQQRRIAPERLHLELGLEDIRDGDHAVPLAALRETGVRLVLDAFEKPQDILGITDWRAFPFERVDEVKIAAALAPVPGQDFAIEAALWGLAGYARTQGIKLTAKGVETEAQHQMFARLGIFEAQGHFYAPPTTALTVETLARQSHAS